MRVFYKSLSFVTLKPKGKFISHLSLSWVTFSLPAFSVPVSLHMKGLFFTDTLPTLFPPWHQQVNLSALSFKSFPNTDFSKAFRLYPLKKGIHHATRWHWRSTSHPASTGLGAEHPHHCWEGASASAPCPHHSPRKKRPSRALPFVSFLETKHPATGSCPPACELLPLPAQSHAARNSKAATLLRHSNCRRRLGSFFKGQKTPYFCKDWLAEQCCPYDHIQLPSVATFHQAGEKHFHQTHKTEAALSGLGRTHSLLHAKGTVWNKKANEPSCSWQCHHWGCSHKGAVKLAG